MLRANSERNGADATGGCGYEVAHGVLRRDACGDGEDFQRCMVAQEAGGDGEIGVTKAWFDVG